MGLRARVATSYLVYEGVRKGGGSKKKAWKEAFGIFVGYSVKTAKVKPQEYPVNNTDQQPLGKRAVVSINGDGSATLGAEPEVKKTSEPEVKKASEPEVKKASEPKVRFYPDPDPKLDPYPELDPYDLHDLFTARPVNRGMRPSTNPFDFHDRPEVGKIEYFNDEVKEISDIGFWFLVSLMDNKNMDDKTIAEKFRSYISRFNIFEGRHIVDIINNIEEASKNSGGMSPELKENLVDEIREELLTPITEQLLAQFFYENADNAKAFSESLTDMFKSDTNFILSLERLCPGILGRKEMYFGEADYNKIKEIINRELVRGNQKIGNPNPNPNPLDRRQSSHDEPFNNLYNTLKSKYSSWTDDGELLKEEPGNVDDKAVYAGILYLEALLEIEGVEDKTIVQNFKNFINRSEVDGEQVAQIFYEVEKSPSGIREELKSKLVDNAQDVLYAKVTDDFLEHVYYTHHGDLYGFSDPLNILFFSDSDDAAFIQALQSYPDMLATHKVHLDSNGVQKIREHLKQRLSNDEKLDAYKLHALLERESGSLESKYGPLENKNGGILKVNPSQKNVVTPDGLHDVAIGPFLSNKGRISLDALHLSELMTKHQNNDVIVREFVEYIGSHNPVPHSYLLEQIFKAVGKDHSEAGDVSKELKAAILDSARETYGDNTTLAALYLSELIQDIKDNKIITKMFMKYFESYTTSSGVVIYNDANDIQRIFDHQKMCSISDELKNSIMRYF